MSFTVKALTAELATTFVDYLENLNFGHAPSLCDVARI